MFVQNRSKLYPDTVEKSLPDMPVTMGKKIKMDNDYYADCVHDFGTRRLVAGGDNLPGQNINSVTQQRAGSWEPTYLWIKGWSIWVNVLSKNNVVDMRTKSLGPQ